MRVLLVEDDKSIITNLSEFLGNEGYDVVHATGQTDALRIVESEPLDLVLLDVSLAEGNGFAVCSAIKAKGDIPVIFLTASGDEFSVVTGFELGADDYVNKPFRPRELLLRIKNALRKKGGGVHTIEIGSLKIDTEKATVCKNGKVLFLSALEFRLLLVFINNKGIVLTRNKLLEEIWDVAGEFVNDNTLTVYIKRLRDKIEDDAQNPTIITTVRGIGYKLGE